MSLYEVYYGGIEPSFVKTQESAAALSSAHALLGDALQVLASANGGTHRLAEPIATFSEAQQKVGMAIERLKTIPAILNPYVASLGFPELGEIETDYAETIASAPSPTAEIIGKDLKLYTLIPDDTPSAYSGGIYRHVVGVQYQEPGIWLPDVEQDKTEAMRFEVPNALGQNIREYFREYYIDAPNKYRNCHIGAAAMTGSAGTHWAEALDQAITHLTHGMRTDPPALNVGEWGSYCAYEANHLPSAYHSLIGIAPGLGLQTDCEHGPMSVVSHIHNLEYYSQIETTDLKLYRMSNRR